MQHKPSTALGKTYALLVIPPPGFCWPLDLKKPKGLSHNACITTSQKQARLR
jgi:hypothetical protein